jgi:hypothetical protein
VASNNPDPSTPEEKDNTTPLASGSSSFKSSTSETDTQIQQQLTPATKVTQLPSKMNDHLDIANAKLVTEKMDKDNFNSWRWGIITPLGYKMLDDFILIEQTDDMRKKPDYKIKNRMTTNFIRMHLTTRNLERFVKDVTDYDTKKLWDSIGAHFATKMMENTANALDKFFDIQFLEGDMEKSIDSFCHSFRHLCEVGTKFEN